MESDSRALMESLGPIEQLQAEQTRSFGVLDPDRPEVLEKLRQSPFLALDIETDSFHAYQERVCLIQLATADEDWIFDPLPKGLPDAVAQLLAHQAHSLVLHAGDNEVRAFKRDFDLQLGPLFDTALAARVLGLPRTGLKDLLETYIDIVIDKGEQRSDWAKRPLELEQLRYARQDVQWLIPLQHALRKELEMQGRLDWLIEECERVRQVEPTQKIFDEHGWRKVKAAKGLGRRGRSVMMSLWSWREDIAKRKNIASFRVARPEQLARVARAADERGAKVVDGLRSGRWVPSGFEPDELCQVVEKGMSAPDPGIKRPQKAPSTGTKLVPMNHETRERLQRLKQQRQQWSSSLGLDAGFLLSNQQLERIARAGPRSLDELRAVNCIGNWRVDVLGQEIVDVVSK